MRFRVLTDVYQTTMSSHILEALAGEDEGLSAREVAVKMEAMWGVRFATDDIVTALRKNRIRCGPGMVIARKKGTSPTRYRLLYDARMSSMDRAALRFSEQIHGASAGSVEEPTREILALFTTKFLIRGEELRREGGRVHLNRRNHVRIMAAVDPDDEAEEALYERLGDEVEKVRMHGGRCTTWIFCMFFSEEEQRKRVEEALDLLKLIDARDVYFVNNVAAKERVLRHLDVMYNGPTMEIVHAGGGWAVRNPDASVCA